MSEELDDDLYARIVAHTDRGNAYCEADDDLRAAIREYEQALELIPEPIERWEASTWVLTALGDCHYLLDEFEPAHHYLTSAMYCPGAVGTGFIHMRLGQVQYELNNEARAKDELARAYMLEGKELFEQEDPKYLQFLRRFMRDI